MDCSFTVLAAPIVVIETSFGKIEVNLDSEKAPISVNNFLNYVDSGFYNQTIMHRVVKNFVIQGGGLNEKPGYAVFGKVISGLDVVDSIAAVTVKTVGEYENVPEQLIKIRIYRKAET
ncbi:MAG: peptidylprolyl isomerase [Bdellovibrionales bacterium]